MNSFFCALLVVAFSAAAAPLGFAATHRVDSLAALQARINSATPGDIITVRNGTYSTTEAIVVNRIGTAQQAITIAAETPGGVTLAGSHGFQVNAPAAHIVIDGFTFTHQSGRTKIAGGTSHVRFTRNSFRCTGAGPYLSVTGDHAQIDYNEFRDKHTLGNMIDVTGTNGQVARGLWIHHNYFHDFTNAGGNGAETIRFGLSGLSMSTGGGIVEHNLFVRCNGENELISNKSGGNTYRFNTLIDSPGAQLTLRHGNECVVYGNYFKNTDGLRIFGDRHHIFGNYFEGNTLGINLGNGGAEVADGAPLTSHDRPDGCVISFNTLVDNRVHYAMNRRTPTALGATNTTFAHNALQGGGVAVKIEGPNVGAQWSGNLLWQTGGAGDLPAAGFEEKDPRLVRDADGILRPSRSETHSTPVAKGLPSPAEISGQMRILTDKDVGPKARP